MRRSKIASRVGITISKKVAKAHARNKIKRQIKEILRALPDLPAKRDYVVIARPKAVLADFQTKKNELVFLLTKSNPPSKG